MLNAFDYTLIIAVILGALAYGFARLTDRIAKGKSRPVAKPPRRDIPVEETDGGKLFRDIMERGCLECGTRDDYVEGPSGGLSTNIFCARCGAGYNITPLVGIAERIGSNPRYIDPKYKPKVTCDRCKDTHEVWYSGDHGERNVLGPCPECRPDQARPFARGER